MANPTLESWEVAWAPAKDGIDKHMWLGLRDVSQVATRKKNETDKQYRDHLAKIASNHFKSNENIRVFHAFSMGKNANVYLQLCYLNDVDAWYNRGHVVISAISKTTSIDLFHTHYIKVEDTFKMIIASSDQFGDTIAQRNGLNHFVMSRKEFSS